MSALPEGRSTNFPSWNVAPVPTSATSFGALIRAAATPDWVVVTARWGVTEEAAVAAIESACRLLRLPTIRSRFAEIAAQPSGISCRTRVFLLSW